MTIPKNKNKKNKNYLRQKINYNMYLYQRQLFCNLGFPYTTVNFEIIITSYIFSALSDR